MSDTKDIVLVGCWYVDDGWYGKRYRVILSATADVGFTTKSQAKKYASKLTKFIKSKYQQKVLSKELLCDERVNFPGYTYVSFGPSLSYKHFDIDVEQLEKYLKDSC